MKKIRVMFTGEEGNLAKAISAALNGHPFIEVVEPSLPVSYVGGHHPWPELDVTNPTLMKTAVQISQANVVVHSAAVVNTDKCAGNPQRSVDVNILGTQNVIAACSEAGAKLMYFSTTATYDPSPNMPRPFVESSPQKPPTLYGITKYAGELLVTGQKEVPYTVVRPCFIYGDPPRDHSSQLCRVAVHHVLKTRTNKAGPTPRVTLNPLAFKDYMRVEDFADAVVKLLELNSYIGHAFNVSAMVARPMRAYFDLLAYCLDKQRVPLDMLWLPESDYMGDHIVDSSLLRNTTGWKPKYTMEDGVLKLAVAAEKYAIACRDKGAELLYA